MQKKPFEANVLMKVVKVPDYFHGIEVASTKLESFLNKDSRDQLS